MRSDEVGWVGLGGRGSEVGSREGRSVGRSVGRREGGRTLGTYKVITNTHATINVE